MYIVLGILFSHQTFDYYCTCYLWAAQGEVINDDYDQLRTTHFLICLLCVCLVIIWSIHNGYTVNCAILMVIGHSKYEWIWEIYIFHPSIYLFSMLAKLSVLNVLNFIFKNFFHSQTRRHSWGQGQLYIAYKRPKSSLSTSWVPSHSCHRSRCTNHWYILWCSFDVQIFGSGSCHVLWLPWKMGQENRSQRSTSFKATRHWQGCVP